MMAAENTQNVKGPLLCLAHRFWDDDDNNADIVVECDSGTIGNSSNVFKIFRFMSVLLVFET